MKYEVYAHYNGYLNAKKVKFYDAEATVCSENPKCIALQEAVGLVTTAAEAKNLLKPEIRVLVFEEEA